MKKRNAVHAGHLLAKSFEKLNTQISYKVENQLRDMTWGDHFSRHKMDDIMVDLHSSLYRVGQDLEET